jgi:Fis family transcriptional regulator
MTRCPLQPRVQARSAARAEAAERESELSLTVRKMMRQYFKDLDGEKPSGIYNMVVNCVEKPLLEVVMYHAQGNQKLLEHGID